MNWRIKMLPERERLLMEEIIRCFPHVREVGVEEPVVEVQASLWEQTS